MQRCYNKYRGEAPNTKGIPSAYRENQSQIFGDKSNNIGINEAEYPQYGNIAKKYPKQDFNFLVAIWLYVFSTAAYGADIQAERRCDG